MSSEIAVSVNQLSKIYSLGRTGRTSSIPALLNSFVRHPFRRSPKERFHALDDVTFDVEEGEVIGVVGKNGAGKSTLLKILSRITTPTSGYVDIEGRVGSLLEVGTGFHPELTGIENVYLNGTILGMTKREIDDRLERITAFAEVDKFLDTPVKRYSSGMRVRLAFAVAAHLEPEILVIDEVLSVGDAGFQSKCIDKMRAIASEDGRTVVYVSHNLVSVEHLCPRSLLLVDGRVVFDGATQDTLAMYLATFRQSESTGIDGVFELGIADRSDGQYEPVFQRVEVRPNGGDPSMLVRMGGMVQFEIAVEGLADDPSAIVIATVGSSTSQNLFRIHENMKRIAVAQERCSQETIVLTIPALPLTPGEYHLDLQLKGRDIRGTIDHVSRAATFTVVSTDLLGTGFQYGANEGPILVPFDWELRPARVEA